MTSYANKEIVIEGKAVNCIKLCEYKNRTDFTTGRSYDQISWLRGDNGKVYEQKFFHNAPVVSKDEFAAAVQLQTSFRKMLEEGIEEDKKEIKVGKVVSFAAQAAAAIAIVSMVATQLAPMFM